VVEITASTDFIPGLGVYGILFMDWGGDKEAFKTVGQSDSMVGRRSSVFLNRLVTGISGQQALYGPTTADSLDLLIEELSEFPVRNKSSLLSGTLSSATRLSLRYGWCIRTIKNSTIVA